MTNKEGHIRRRLRELELVRRVSYTLLAAAAAAVPAALVISTLGDEWRWWQRPTFGAALPDSWELALTFDFAWLAGVVLFAMVARHESWSDRSARPLSRGLHAATLALTVAASITENVLLLSDSADYVAGNMRGSAAVTVWASNTQLGSLVALALITAYLWTIPPPGRPDPAESESTGEKPSRRSTLSAITTTAVDWLLCRERDEETTATPRTPTPGPEVTWHGSAARPDVEEGKPHPWDPDPRRLGISVSGGGIRSASFALGALQELRNAEVLQKARYVASVSGGGYTTSALTALNFDSEVPAYKPNSAEEQQLRRSLRYLVDRNNITAIGRILLGLLLNIVIVYALIVISFRPLGWLIGTPLVQEGLRLDGPVAMEILGESDDPDLKTPADQPFARCIGSGAPSTTSAIEREVIIGSGDNAQAAVLFGVSDTDVCVRLRHLDGSETFASVRLTQAEPGLITFDATGTATVAEQPSVQLDDEFRNVAGAGLPADLTPADVVAPRQPRFSVDATGVPALRRAEILDERDAVAVESASSVQERSASNRRAGPVDIDTRHWAPALILVFAGLILAIYRSVGRPNSYKFVDGWRKRFFGVALGWTLIFLAFPWLASEAPGWFNGLLDGGRVSQALPAWLPINADAVPPIVAFMILAGSSIAKFLSIARPKTTAAPSEPKSRRGQALMKKLGGFLQTAAIVLVLVVMIGGGAIVELAAGAANGPSGTFPWTTLNLFGRELPSTIPDLAIWAATAAIATISIGWGESSAWSPAPIYKRRFSRAFHLERNDDGTVKPRSYNNSKGWEEIVPLADKTRDAAGYLDGHHGDGAELVLCMAANIDEPRKSPVGRQSVSFTASRSYIGGPEVGWLPMQEYRGRMGRRRAWDLNLPGLAALSGAAVSPAMGKNRAGQQVGRLLALLNVRLGAWLPHPQWVNAHPTPWHHNPGWPWYVRELKGDYRHDAPYLYVSDGGHWENLAIVEAMRRGCMTIVAICASGDGPQRLFDVAEAVEIARADLGIEVQIDDIWKTRAPVDTDIDKVLDSGRQYVVNPGPSSSLGRVAEQGFAFGTFTLPDTASDAPTDVAARTGQLLIIDATMVDGLPADAHSYAENHPEFPNVSTGDQLFTDRDFEAYRILGRELVKRAMAATKGMAPEFHAAVAAATRNGSPETPPAPPTTAEPTPPTNETTVVEVRRIQRVTETVVRFVRRGRDS